MYAGWKSELLLILEVTKTPN